jgi:hypothetical protein
VDADIALAEVLLVPLYVAEAVPLGTLWIVAEDEGHFDGGHAGVMSEFAAVVGMAVNMIRTEQRPHEALEQQELLTKEMNHRVKNLFTITQGMIHAVAPSASTPREMSQILSGRLHALADAHSLVRRTFTDARSAGPNYCSAARRGRRIGPVQDVAHWSGWANMPPTDLRSFATNSQQTPRYGALLSEEGFDQISW